MKIHRSGNNDTPVLTEAPTTSQLVRAFQRTAKTVRPGLVTARPRRDHNLGGGLAARKRKSTSQKNPHGQGGYWGVEGGTSFNSKLGRSARSGLERQGQRLPQLAEKKKISMHHLDGQHADVENGARQLSPYKK